MNTMKVDSSDDFYNLLYPDEALDLHKDLLLDYYTNEYSWKFRKCIEERAAKTIYLFDSDPFYTYKFLQENEKYVFDYEQMEKVTNQVLDLEKIKKKYDEKLALEVYKLFCRYHDISFGDYKNKYEEILMLLADLPSFGNAYSEGCSALGIRPINEQEKFNAFLDSKVQCERRSKELVLRESLWLEDMRDSLIKRQALLGNDLLVFIFNGRYTSVCFNLSNGYRIVKVPIVESYYKGIAIDRTFFHENRHGVEASEIFPSIIGLDMLYEDLKILNEIRTELHAKNDENTLPKIFLRKQNINMTSTYENLFGLSKNLFSKYGYILDECAIENNLDKLFNIFGKKEMLEYGTLLNETFRSVKNFFKSDDKELVINPSRHFDVEEQLIKNANDKGYGAYQKIL